MRIRDSQARSLRRDRGAPALARRPASFRDVRQTLRLRQAVAQESRIGVIVPPRSAGKLNAPVQGTSGPGLRGSGRKIPVIDYGPYFAGEPGALERVAAEVAHACENVGFFYALNHGVPEKLIDRAFAASRRFHALPLDAKTDAQAQREQHRLSADERLGAGRLDRAQGDQAQPERELFHQPRPRPRSSRCGRRQAVARPQPMAGGRCPGCAPT